MFGIFNIIYAFKSFLKVQGIAIEDKFSIARIANKETKKQRNKETQEALLLKTGRKFDF